MQPMRRVTVLVSPGNRHQNVALFSKPCLNPERWSDEAVSGLKARAYDGSQNTEL